MSIKLLDCTLRDGGYLNDWEFGRNNYLSIYERLVASAVDIIEVGFVDDRRPYDINKTIYPDTSAISRSFGKIKNKAPLTVAMIDYGTCNISNVEDCDDSWVDGIRVIFKKHLMHEAMEYCRLLKNKGYKVFSNLVAVSDYTEEDLIEISRIINDVRPYAICMVDTYGLMYPNDVTRIFKILDTNIQKDIRIGFHSHNNLQLGFANNLALIQNAGDRDITIDATLFGMGKSAGNGPIELVADYLNKNKGKNYQINQMLEAIGESIIDMYGKYSWGYKTFFYLAAKNNCHPKYVGYFQDKNNFSLSDIDAILDDEIPFERKLKYDETLSAEIYNTYRDKRYNDITEYNDLLSVINNRKILFIGPGKNIFLQKDKVDAFIKAEKPLCISINHIPEYLRTDYVFITTSQRYLDMTDKLLSTEFSDIGIIATSNVTSKSRDFDFVFDREKLLNRNQKIIDNSFLMLLQIIKNLNIQNVYCAGLDGYSDRGDNYFDNNMEYRFHNMDALSMNKCIRDSVKQISMNVHFITYSHYEEEID